MVLNPVTLCRRWRANRQKRRDMRLRLRCMELSVSMGGLQDVCHKRAYLMFLFIKYGMNKDGKPLREIFLPDDPKLPYYEGPIQNHD